MELTWHKGYEDYDDPAWPPRREHLTAIWQSVSLAQAGEMDTDALLNHLELTEELMRYYTAISDFRNLEPLMRSYEPMLRLLEPRHPDTAGYWYLETEYNRLNALLYLDQKSNQQALKYYEQALVCSDSCYSCLQSEAGQYNDEQRLFLAWSCAECRGEMALACERTLNNTRMYQVLTGTIPILQYIETCLKDAYGIWEKTAELYARIGAAYYQNNEFGNGDVYYGASERMYAELAEEVDSDFYRAKQLWTHGLHGIDAFTRAGNANVMLACEQEVQAFLSAGAAGRDRAIAQGALGMTYMQRGIAFQQSGDLKAAIQWTEQSADLFGNAQEALEKEMGNLENSLARSELSTIAARLYSSNVAAMDVLGVQYFASDRFDEAQGVFEETLSMLTDPPGYSMAENASLLIRAECCEYLALLAVNGNDKHKVDFYGLQAMDLGEEAARKSGNPAAWQLVIISASLVSEVAEAMKEKQKMGTVAARGLAACDELARLTPDNDFLSMRGNLERREKKSKRRFF